MYHGKGQSCTSFSKQGRKKYYGGNKHNKSNYNMYYIEMNPEVEAKAEMQKRKNIIFRNFK